MISCFPTEFLDNNKKIELFVCKNPIEKVNTLKVLNYGPSLPNQLPDVVRFADILIKDCLKDDILSVSFSYQITNNLSYAVENACALMLTESSDAIKSNYVIVHGKGYNITPEMHHGPQVFSGNIKIPYDGNWFVFAQVYAGGSSFTKSGDSVTVDTGYGDLSVIRFRV